MIGLLAIASVLAVRATAASTPASTSDASKRNSTGSGDPSLTGHLLKFLNHFDDSIIGFHLIVPHEDVLFDGLTAGKSCCRNELLEYVNQINRLRNMIENDPQISLKSKSKKRFKNGRPAANDSCNVRQVDLLVLRGSPKFRNDSVSVSVPSTENPAKKTESVPNPIKVSRIASKPVSILKSGSFDAKNTSFRRRKSFNKTKFMKKFLKLKKANRYSDGDGAVLPVSGRNGATESQAAAVTGPSRVRSIRSVPARTSLHGLGSSGPRVSRAAEKDDPSSSERRNDAGLTKRELLRHDSNDFRGSFDRYLPVVRYYNVSKTDKKSVGKHFDDTDTCQFYSSHIEFSDFLKHLLSSFMLKDGVIKCGSYTVKPGGIRPDDAMSSVSNANDVTIFLILNPKKPLRTSLDRFYTGKEDSVNSTSDRRAEGRGDERGKGGSAIDCAPTESAAAKSETDVRAERRPEESRDGDSLESLNTAEPSGLGVSLSGGLDTSVPTIRTFSEDSVFRIRSLAEKVIGRTGSEKRTVRKRRSAARDSREDPKESSDVKFETEGNIRDATDGRVEAALDSTDPDYGAPNDDGTTPSASDRTADAQVDSPPHRQTDASDTSDASGVAAEVSSATVEVSAATADDFPTESVDACGNPYSSKAVKKTSREERNGTSDEINYKVMAARGLPDFIKLYNNNIKQSLMKRLNQTNHDKGDSTGPDKLVETFRPISSSVRDIDRLVKKIGNKQPFRFLNDSRYPESGQNFSDIRLVTLFQAPSGAAEGPRNGSVDSEPSSEARDSSGTDGCRSESRTAGYKSASTAERRVDRPPDPPQDLRVAVPSNLLIKLTDLRKTDDTNLRVYTTENIRPVSCRSMASADIRDPAGADRSGERSRSDDSSGPPVYLYPDESPSRSSTTPDSDGPLRHPTDRDRTEADRTRDSLIHSSMCGGSDAGVATRRPDPSSGRDELPPFAPIISVNIFPIVGGRKRPPPIEASSLIKELLRTSRNRLDRERSSDLSDLIDIKGVRSSEKARINESLKKKLEAILTGRGCINDLMKVKLHNILELSNRNGKNRNFMSLT